MATRNTRKPRKSASGPAVPEEMQKLADEIGKAMIQKLLDDYGDKNQPEDTSSIARSRAIVGALKAYEQKNGTTFLTELSAMVSLLTGQDFSLLPEGRGKPPDLTVPKAPAGPDPDTCRTLLAAWNARTLAPCYPFVFMDQLLVRTIDARGLSVPRTLGLFLGIDTDGRKELLALELSGTAKQTPDEARMSEEMCAKMSGELRSRGVEAVCLVCADDTALVQKACARTFPSAQLLPSMVHLMRVSQTHVSWKEQKTWTAACRTLYSAEDLAGARRALEALEAAWGQEHIAAVGFWKRRFDSHIAPLYALPSGIRQMLSSTDAGASVDSSLGAMLRRGCPAEDDAILASVLLRAQHVLGSNPKRRAIRNWAHLCNELVTYEQTREVCETYLFAGTV